MADNSGFVPELPNRGQFPQFQATVVLPSKAEMDAFRPQLENVEGYQIVDSARDWVTMHPSGPVEITANNEISYPPYAKLKEMLVTEGFDCSKTHWGQNYFAKKEKKPEPGKAAA